MCEMTEKFLPADEMQTITRLKRAKFKAPIAYHFNWDVLDSLTKLW